MLQTQMISSCHKSGREEDSSLCRPRSSSPYSSSANMLLLHSQQQFSNNFSDLLTPPYSEETNGIGLHDDLDAFSEISLTQVSNCNPVELSLLPSFQETYSTLGFRMEEEQFGLENHQIPVGQQSTNIPNHCEMPNDFGQVFNPLSSTSYFSHQMYGQEVQPHQHNFPAQLSQPVFEPNSELQQMQFGLPTYAEEPSVMDEHGQQTFTMKRRPVVTQRNQNFSNYNELNNKLKLLSEPSVMASMSNTGPTTLPRINVGYEQSSKCVVSSANPLTRSYPTTSAPSHVQIQTQATSSQLCAVCGDTAACQHYGVRTCEGCKGFFKRTVQKGSKYVCLAEKSCPVDKRRRNRCQYCRFQKCLSVGMVKEVVRTDSLKGRRGRLPSKPKTSQDSSTSPAINIISVLVRAHIDTSPDLSSLDYSQYEECETSESRMDEARQLELFYHLLCSSIKLIRNFADKIPLFNELTNEDQNLLFQAASLDLFVLRLTYRIRRADSKIIFCNGVVLNKQQCIFSFGDWLQSIIEFSEEIQSMQIDLPTFVALCALTIISDRHGLKEPYKVEQMQINIISSLKNHLSFGIDSQQKSYFISSLLNKIPELRSISNQGLQRIFYLKLEALVPVPPLLEKMFVSALPF